MERSALSPAIIVRENALATYLGLVAPVRGSVVTRPGGYVLVRGPGPFSFCNFAAGFELGEGDLNQTVDNLVRQAEECPGFYVFVITGDSPQSFPAALGAAGFEKRQSLVSLFAKGVEGPTDAGARGVTDPDERRSIAAFMSKQFFWSMPSEAREGIAAATAASPHTIWAVGPAERPEGAVMLVETPGAVGLFNLCVRPELRGKGLGTSLVRAVQTAATASGRPVVLQCAQDLVAWYTRLGFERVGKVDAYTISPEETGDILD